MDTIMNCNKDVLQKLYTNAGIPKKSKKFETFESLNETISNDKIKKVKKSLKMNKAPRKWQYH